MLHLQQCAYECNGEVWNEIDCTVGLFFRKCVCEAVSALILLSLLDAGACLLGDFVKLCDVVAMKRGRSKRKHEWVMGVEC